MVSHAAELEDEVRPLRREEYDRLVDLGVFEGEKLELLFGRIVHMAPQGDDHSDVIDLLGERLILALHPRAVVRTQLPFVASDESEPEPDIAVCPPRPWRLRKPDQAHLVIEIAATSQRKDRGPKAAVYALAGVPEYWIIDVDKRRIERYRRPVDGRYAECSMHAADETVAIEAFPDVAVRLCDMLP